jgi:hypothetical protein
MKRDEQQLTMTNKIVLIFICVILIGCQGKLVAKPVKIDNSEKGHRIYNSLPCYFNGAEVGTSANAAAFGPRWRRCCPSCKGYGGKKGTSIIVPRGTPVIAIADMEIFWASNNSSEQNSRGLEKEKRKSYRKEHLFTTRIMKPFDDIHLMFEDKHGNWIFYYHLMSTPIVPGFDKGDCKRPLEYNTQPWKRDPENCGGYAYKAVKKGDVIGLSGDTGGGRKGDKHFSLGILVMNNKLGIMQWVAPEDYFYWENLPSESDAYLFPVQSKKYLKKIGYIE